MTAEKVDVIALAVGLGTRLQAEVNDRPKPLAPVRGRPFLDYIFRFLQKEGVVRRAVLAIGYRAEQIEAEYHNRTDFGFPFLFYVLGRLFQTVPSETKISPEHDLMPGFAAGRLFGFKMGGFIDIGLAETYTNAEHFLK